MYQTNFIPQGWECPKCKRVYSPTTSMCAHCPTQTMTGTTSTSIQFSEFGTTGTSLTHNFESDKKSSSKTKCKICGREKWQHPISSFT